jgi:hypothetical protein
MAKAFKPPKDKRTEKELIAEGIEIATMGVREVMMEYFKGSCYAKFAADKAQIYFNNMSTLSNFYYQRREETIAQRKKLFMGDYRIAFVSHEPEVATFSKDVFEMNDEMKKMYQGIEKFFADYLPGVQLTKETETDGRTPTITNDVFIQIAKRVVDTPRERNSIQEFYYDEYANMPEVEPMPDPASFSRGLVTYTDGSWVQSVSTSNVATPSMTANELYDQMRRRGMF